MKKTALELIVENFLTKNPVLNLARCNDKGATSFPKEIEKLIHLEELYNYDKHEIPGIPNDYNNYTNVDTVRYYSFKNLNNITVLSKLVNLKKITICQSDLQDISPLAGLVNLEILDLSENAIIDISPLPNLAKLKSLNLFGNKLENIFTISKFEHLNSLDMRFCNIKNITFLHNMPKLGSLDITLNEEVKSIQEIANLQELHSLFLEGNGVVDISPLAELTNLEYLVLDSMQNLSKSGMEKFVTVNKDKIFGYFEYTDFYIADGGETLNEIADLYAESDFFCRNLFNYFEKIKKESQENLIFGKLMLLGMPAVGKTSLYKKLIDPSLDLDFQELGTHSMNIGEWEFKYTNPKNTPTHEDFNGKFKANILDFAGDESIQPTHRYFMREDCVYAILVNPREQEKVDWFYWLSSIRQYGGEKSPIFIIFNNKENQHYAGQLPADVQDLGFNIQGVFNIDLKTNLGLAQLSQALQFALQNLPEVGDAIPKSWAIMQNKLSVEAQKQPYIDFDAFEQIYSEVETYEDKTIENTCRLAKILDKFNKILYFPDKGMLSETIILVTEWATRAAYKIYWDVPTKKTFGAFKFGDLKRILAPVKEVEAENTLKIRVTNNFLSDSYKFSPYELTFLLNLMETFGIAYEVGKTANYIVPALLSEQRPANALLPLFNTNEPQAFYRFKIHFPKLMPKGIIPLFIVRQHTQIFEQAQWKTGVLLRINQPNAYVEVQERRAGGTQEIECTIKTQAPKEAAKKVYENLLGEVLKEIDPHKNLGYELWIACPCDVCKTSKEPHFYKYADLEKREKAGKREVECNVSYQDLHVRDLLLDLDKGGYSGNEMDFFKKKARQEAQKEFVATGFKQLGGKIVETVKIGFTTFLETFLANIQTLKQPNKDEETLIVEIQESIDADAQIAQESEKYAQALQTLIPQSDKLNANSRKYLQTGLYLENSEFLQNNTAYSVAALQFCRAVEQEMMTLIEGFKAWVQLKPEPQTLKGYEKDLYDELLKFINSTAHFHISFGYLCGFLEYALPEKSTYALRKTALFKAFISFLDIRFDRRKHDALFLQMIQNIILLKKGDYRNKSAHIGEITKTELSTCKDLVINILRNFTDSKK